MQLVRMRRMYPVIHPWGTCGACSDDGGRNRNLLDGFWYKSRSSLCVWSKSDSL